MNQRIKIKANYWGSVEERDSYDDDHPHPIYEWWWKFMRLSPVFWYARTYGVEIKDQKINETFHLAGDLSERMFILWWKKQRSVAFQEVKRFAQVKVLDINNLHDHIFNSNSLYLEIPLDMTRSKINRSINKELKKVHEGRFFDAAKTTTANLKIFTKKFRLPTIEKEYWSYLYRLIYPKIEVWRIGDRLKVSPSANLRSIERIDNLSSFRKMDSLVGRYIYKAKFTLQNVEYGIFPNPNKPNFYNEIPFGIKHHKDFLDKTINTSKKTTEYHKWIAKELRNELDQYVIQINKLREFMRMPDSPVRKRFPDFVSGKSDLLDDDNKPAGIIDIENRSGDSFSANNKKKKSK
jgi:hypothetical protein